MPDHDLLSLWNAHLERSQAATEQPPAPERAVPLPSPTPQNTFRAAPTLNGRLAEYLSTQTPRKITSEIHPTQESAGSFTVTDPQAKIALAVSLILTTNITRFAGTTVPEQSLINTRNELMRALSATDAVHAEVEAYDLLNWLAGALNENLKKTETGDSTLTCCPETTASALIGILSDAISHKRDLTMRYYTGSRGAFSERRITPIEITAEKYLIAFCHVRNEERVFRLTRIVSLIPIPNPGESQQDLLCYPNQADTIPPPLPDTPAPHASETPKPRRAKDNKAKKNAKKPRSHGEKEAENPSKINPSAPHTRTLFDLLDSAITPSEAPKKKKKRATPRLLPGITPD
ncbi:MAG: WYL domain-containing protein [Proteobacteria bacterium]|nr:WYL domain-containing protein [Pseudomonadota bacterium]